MPIVQISPEVMQHQPAPYVDMLREASFTIRYSRHPQFSRGLCTEQETIDELRGASAALAGAEMYTPGVLAALPELRVVARAGVGYDRVDIPSATARSVAVTITPTANHEAVAEFALALLFSVAKSIVAWDKQTRAGGWPREPRVPIRGQTIGVLGLGRIGKSMAVRCAALGMKVIASEQFPDHEFLRKHAIELVDFDTLLARSNVVTIHCPLTEQTTGLFNRATFAKMKPGSILINTARGKLVVEADLLAALQSGQLSAAGLDVFEQEPPALDNPLFKLDNVVVSPHIAGSDVLSLENMGLEAAGCIIKLYRGEWPEGAVVNAELKGKFKW